MQAKTSATVLGILLCAGCGSGRGLLTANNLVADGRTALVDGDPGEDAIWQTVTTNATASLAKTHTPGASIAVVLHGKLAFTAALGEKRTDTHAPVTDATLFRAASMSKMILASSAMSLVDQGKLDLNAPITKYIPWFKLKSGFDASTISMSQLLSHTAGFPGDTIGQCDDTTSGPRQAFFASTPEPLWAPPGMVYDYSNTGFALASLVVSSAAGVGDDGFEQFVHDRVFVPAGMTTATYDAQTAQAGDYAIGYDLNGDFSVADVNSPTDLDCPLLHPPGGIFATATDYANFAATFMAGGGTMISPASVAAMETPRMSLHTYPNENYAYALENDDYPYPGHPVIWHDGALPGFYSDLVMVPDQGFAVAVFVNAAGDDDASEDIALDAMKRFLTLAQTQPPDPTADPSTWAGYVGTYKDPYGTLGTVTVSLGKDSHGAPALIATAPTSVDVDGSALPVAGPMTKNQGDDWSAGDDDGTEVTFYPGADGKFDYFVTRRGIAVREQ